MKLLVAVLIALLFVLFLYLRPPSVPKPLQDPELNTINSFVIGAAQLSAAFRH